MELGSIYYRVILRLEETLGFNHTRPWSQGHYFPCANWSLAKKKKLPLLKSWWVKKVVALLLVL